MKCPRCGADTKEGVKTCKACGSALAASPLWLPTWRWHLKVLGVIYLVLVGAFFVLKWLLAPYTRHLPPEVTPWLQPRQTPIEQVPVTPHEPK